MELAAARMPRGTARGRAGGGGTAGRRPATAAGGRLLRPGGNPAAAATKRRSPGCTPPRAGDSRAARGAAAGVADHPGRVGGQPAGPGRHARRQRPDRPRSGSLRPLSRRARAAGRRGQLQRPRPGVPVDRPGTDRQTAGRRGGSPGRVDAVAAVAGDRRAVGAGGSRQSGRRAIWPSSSCNWRRIWWPPATRPVRFRFCAPASKSAHNWPAKRRAMPRGWKRCAPSTSGCRICLSGPAGGRKGSPNSSGWPAWPSGCSRSSLS